MRVKGPIVKRKKKATMTDWAWGQNGKMRVTMHKFEGKGKTPIRRRRRILQVNKNFYKKCESPGS